MRPISAHEIRQAISKIKSGKAPGLDNIPPEALKADSATTAEIMHSLLLDIWEKEEIPVEWKTGLIIKLPKKGDLGDCNNWRGIQLLSLPSKVLTRILLERLKMAVDGKLRDEQAGFRAGRSCTDQIAVLRIIVEQSLEWRTPVYMNFIDFRKAFDMIDRRMIWKIMHHYGIPKKFVNIIRSIYEGTSCQVVHGPSLSTPFDVSTGVRQGCLLSPMIFLLVIDWVLRGTTADIPRGLHWTFIKKLEDLDFADDICLLSHSLQHIQQKSNRLEETALKTGLAINTTKTKSMRVNAQHTQPLTVSGHQLEDVASFCYLGSVVGTTGGTEQDVKARIGKARQAFVLLRPVWRNANLRLSTKLRLFQSNVIMVLLYGSETWSLTRQLDSKLQVFVNTCLRQILQVRWPDTISNRELWRRTGQAPIATVIRQHKWRWIGHTLRKSNQSIVRQALDWNPQGSRKRGRPARTWRRNLDAELRTVSMSWAEAKVVAQDRSRWKGVVKALCSS